MQAGRAGGVETARARPADREATRHERRTASPGRMYPRARVDGMGAMTELERRAGRLAVGLAVLLASCTLIHHEDAVAERCVGGLDEDIDGRIDCDDSDCAATCDERAQCADGEDDDADDAIDCADSDCDGTEACPEIGASCGDGRDNDADGRIDARDAECWPYATITTERCASVLGGRVVLGPDDFAGGRVVEDPLGTGTAPMLSVPPTPSVTMPVPSVVARAASGALDGTRATVVVWLDGRIVRRTPLDPGVTITLAAATSARVSDRTIDMTVGGLGSLFSGALVPMETFGPAFTVDAGVFERLEITLEIEGRVARATVAAEDGSRTFEAQLSEAWTEGTGLVLGASAGGGGGVWLESATIERPHYERCGTLLPPVGIAMRDGLERTDTSLHAITRGPGAALCALVALRVRDSHELFALRSSDDGETWELGDVISESTTFVASDGRWHAVAWDPIDARYYAVSTVGPVMGIQSSPDCATWDEERIAIDDFTSGGEVQVFRASAPSYEVDALGHTVGILVAQLDGTFALSRQRSPWGDGGSWIGSPLETDTGTTELWSPGGEASTLRFAVREQQLGARVRIADGGTSVRVRLPDGWMDVPALAARPSEEAGSYDASSVLGPATLVEDGVIAAPDVWSGRMFQSGASDLGADDAWGWLRVRITPAGAR
jgi:hypothetical protein